MREIDRGKDANLMETATCLHTTTEEARAAFEAQAKLAPGTDGFWKVWGAQPRHIRPGDLLVTLDEGNLDYALIQETYLAKAAPLRLGFIADGERFTIGALTPISLLRWGTHNTLAD